jgi:hypothetical protein
MTMSDDPRPALPPGVARELTRGPLVLTDRRPVFLSCHAAGYGPVPEPVPSPLDVLRQVTGRGRGSSGAAAPGYTRVRPTD